MYYSRLITTATIILLAMSVPAAPPPDTPVQPSTDTQTASIDNSTFIDANKILMFVTNHGNFGRDLAGVFGYDYGTFYPYLDTNNIRNGFLGDSPLYAASLWMGGKVGSDTNVVISEYSSEYVPGPMVGGTFCPDDPSFKVYKLYADSLESNPNDDYTYWPFDQGAPADDYGRPLCIGDQTLWTVFNDADPAAHTNDAGETDPLGVEVQMLAFAVDDVGNDTLPGSDRIEVEQEGTSVSGAYVRFVDREQLTGHDYRIEIEIDGVLDPVWNLYDETLGHSPLLVDQSFEVPATIDGLEVTVYQYQMPSFLSFQVVQNAGGLIDPPEPGALWFGGFPVPRVYDPDGYISDRQQVTYPGGQWGFHTADNGGTGIGTRGSYDAFLSRVLRDGANTWALGQYDYEMRFTGSYDNFGVGGSYAYEFLSGNSFWVPFELWQIGVGTPNNPSDDVRLIPFIIDDGNDNTYNLESYGTSLDGTCNADCEHSVSSLYNDPFTDWVYWICPVNDAPGSAGYNAAEADMLAGTFTENYDDHYGAEIMARTVLVSWNGGQLPAFVQDLPEQGTVFRILTGKEITVEPDAFTFTAEAMPVITTGDEGTSIYLRYLITNKGGNDITDCYVSLWTDPDLGDAGDDMVGCDTLNDLFFCYNETNDDNQYGEAPPAVGFKYLVGPTVLAPGETMSPCAAPQAGMGMTAFSKLINGTDPDNATESYWYMQGLKKDGTPYVYNSNELTYMYSGDPVTGVGDRDVEGRECRMFASTGPFDLPPDYSVYMLLRMAARHGDSNLDAITELKRVLNLPLPGDICTEVAGSSPNELPNKFAVKQNYPNPFNPSTTIKYSLPERARVTVDVFNVLGQKVKRLVDETQPAGAHSVVWNGDNEGDERVSTGFYFYRVKAGDKIDNKKMLLLK